MITPEQSERLKDYFPVKAHEFLQGATYLSEEAITNRLDEVDPSWEFHRLGEFAYRENFVIATFRMTVCGVSRDGVGMWDLKMTKRDGNVIDATDPEKSVSTDALKRAARLFGIGRYILEMGKAVNDYQSLERWLIQRQGGNVTQMDGRAQQALKGNGPDERTIAPKIDENAPKANVVTNGANSGNAVTARQGYKDGDLFNAVLKSVYDNKPIHMKNSIKKLNDAGLLGPWLTLEEAVEVCRTRKDVPA